MTDHPRHAGVATEDRDLRGGGRAVAPRRRGRRIATRIGLLLLALVLAVAGTAFGLSEALANNVARVPNVFARLDANARPAAGPTQNFLVVGTDTHSPEPTTGTDAAPDAQPGAPRSDVIMVVQMAADKKSASVISVPRNTWVDIPGRGKNRINAAYHLGGASLLVQTVEQLTGVRMDHFAIVDFAGFQAVIDAVKGIDVMVAHRTSNEGVTFQEGANHLDGREALAYVRQVQGLPDGDLDRAHREQNVLRALLTSAASSGTVTNPVALYGLMDAVTRSVSVDDTLTNNGLRELALGSTGLRPSAITNLNAPIADTGRDGVQDIVYLDPTRSAELWAAMRDGKTADYATSHVQDQLSAVPA